MSIIKRLFNSFIFWGAWIIIPVIMEIIPAIGSLLLLLKRHRKIEDYGSLKAYPEITVIIPIYNSEATLFNCVRSVYDSTYPNDSIRVFLVNNKGKDNSFSVFETCQRQFPGLRMQWMDAEQGKSRALNLALYNSKGKYIINVDSDGVLEPHALTNMICKFEADQDLNCMTGAILTAKDQIQAYKGFFPRLLRNLEFMEYAQAFLSGRSYASEQDMLYTLSGAFSAFRKSVILKSWMYNTDTVGEDTHVTFQMRYQQKERVEICENAIFYVDPIESVNKLYTQRQRWQRGSLEVAHMFMGDCFRPTRLLRDVNVKTLLYDHTFAFPRMIWYLAVLCLVGLNYSASAVIFSTLFIFSLYVLVGYFYFAVAASLLKLDPDVRRYYVRHWWCVLLLPFFNLAMFFVRMAGIINSVATTSSWRSKDFRDEKNAFVKVLKEDASGLRSLVKRIRGIVNKSETAEKQTGAGCSAGWYISICLVFVCSAALIIATTWSKKTLGVGLNEIIHTLTGSVEGTGDGMKTAIIKGLVLPILGVAAACMLAVTADIRIGRKLRRSQGSGMSAYRTWHKAAALGVSLTMLSGILYANSEFEMLNYYIEQGSATRIYEDCYVRPSDVAVTAEGKTKNLIYIYVESLETAYASKEAGGAQEMNYIPELTKLAEENVNFSASEKLGGWQVLNGTNWTQAALFATTSGLPYAMQTEEEDLASSMPGVVSLGDVLRDKGYMQEFLCGSDGSFAGKKTYFEQHGGYNVVDVYEARKKGYIPKDYWHNWGIEDKVLFDIAKKELTKLSAKKKPFNFTLLTVDLHATDGYICKWCGKDHSSTTANVAACNDKIVSDFVAWCKKQDFYDDTVIVITGDHPRMDVSLVKDIPREERTVYNCFINAAADCKRGSKNRVFTAVDMFPTVLGAMGFDLKGGRLGLGTNLFSETDTLAEEKGFDWLYQETLKSSAYYVKTFASDEK